MFRAQVTHCIVLRVLFALLGFTLCLLPHVSWSGTLREALPCLDGPDKEVQSQSGLFTVHLACDRVLLEIPQKVLGRDMLANTEFAAASDRADEVAPGSQAISALVRWVRRGDKIYFERVRYERWTRARGSLERGIERVSLPTVIKVFPVLAEGAQGAPVIDVTPLFTTQVGRGFALEFRRRFHMQEVDGARSYIQRVRSFPQNLEVSFYQTWIPDVTELYKSPREGEEPPPASMGFVFHMSLLLLPEVPMPGRCADDRVGYFATPFDEYGTDEHRRVKRAFINRYRLDQQDPTAALSRPVTPIVFYLSREVPEQWRPYIKQGIESWNTVFEQAGFLDAIVARDAPSEQENPNWGPEDVRYSVIRWTPSGRQFAWAPSVVDPRSGEIISSHILFWDDVLKLLETWYFTQVAPLDPRASKLPLPDELTGALLRYLVTHEVGHALGLRHNFKAHSAYTVEQLRDPEWTQRWGTSASIMDYARFNYVAQPGDQAGLFPKFGPYDFFAVEWGYKPLSGSGRCDDGFEELDRIAARQVDEPMLRFGGEDDVADLDPLVNTNVLGGDPIAAADLGLRNIDRVAAMLTSATTRKGQGYGRLSEVYYALILQRHRELAAVAKLVGGVEETRYQAGRGGVPYVAVSASRQREAVQFLVRRAFTTPTNLLDPDLLYRVTPSGAADPLQGSSLALLAKLISPEVFFRMAENEAVNPRDSFTGAALLRVLNNGLFRELEERQPAVSPYRRELQRNYVMLLLVSVGAAPDPQVRFDTQLSDQPLSMDAQAVKVDSQARRSVEWLSSPLAEAAIQYRASKKRPSEFSAALRDGLADLLRKIDQALVRTKDPNTAAHLRDLSAELRQEVQNLARPRSRK